MAVSFYLRLVRHGETDGNVRNVVESHTPTPLNAIGRRQADALGATWRAEGATFQLAISSDTTRPLETCRRALDAAGMTSLGVRPEPLLREREGGSLEGMPMEEARRLQEEARVTGKVIPGLETPVEAQQRAGRFFMKLVEEMTPGGGGSGGEVDGAEGCAVGGSGGRDDGAEGGDGSGGGSDSGSAAGLPEVAVFTHRGFIYCLLVYLQNQHGLQLAEQLPLGQLHCSWNTGQTRLLVTREAAGAVTVRCEFLHRDDHLTGELTPTDYILPGGVRVPRQ